MAKKKRHYILYYQEGSIKFYYEYESLVGVVVVTMDERRAHVFTDGNKKRIMQNRLNKKKSKFIASTLESEHLILGPSRIV